MNPQTAPDRARLLQLLTELSFEKRKVTLASGKESDFYIDCRRTALTAEGHFLIGRMLFAKVREVCPDVEGIGGMTLGADPLASAVSYTSYLAGQPLPAFLVRKEAKEHGTGRSVEAPLSLGKGARVAVLEDTLTTGGSLLRAIEKVEQQGWTVSAAIAIVDRLEGGREAVEQRGYRLHSLFTRKDFLS